MEDLLLGFGNKTARSSPRSSSPAAVIASDSWSAWSSRMSATNDASGTYSVVAGGDDRSARPLRCRPDSSSRCEKLSPPAPADRHSSLPTASSCATACQGNTGEVGGGGEWGGHWRRVCTMRGGRGGCPQPFLPPAAPTWVCLLSCSPWAGTEEHMEAKKREERREAWQRYAPLLPNAY